MKKTKKRYVTAEDLFQYTFLNDPQVSPDGGQVLFVRNGRGSNNLGVLDLESEEIRYLTDYADGTQILGPRWSPDGTRMVFSVVRGEEQDIGIMDASAADLELSAW